jgi:hypothetical protein
LTLAVASTTKAGTYKITVTGKGGSITHTTAVTLTVKVAPNYTLTAAPTAISVARGSSGTSTITTKAIGPFDAAITLAASGQGASQTVTFSANPIPKPGTGTSTMTVKVGTAAALGKHVITITGTGGSTSIKHTATVTLNVTK